MVYHQMIIQ